MSFVIREGTLKELLVIDLLLPEFEQKSSKEKLAQRLKNRKSLLLVACENDKPVAYKLGYEISSSEFYSWLGGVHPDYRKRGIATTLREVQESWAIENGYTNISVKSMNQFPAMLKLLIASGYQVTGYEDNGTAESSKIKFSKKLLNIKE